MLATKQDVACPQEVVDFCVEHKLSESLKLTIERMTLAFPEAERVVVSLEQDPDSHHRWVLVDVVVEGDAKTVSLRHRDCARDLARSLAWPASTLLQTTYTRVRKQ